MKLLTLKFTTPETEKVLKVKYVSLEDILGSLSIYPEHDRYITVLPRSIGHFIDENGDKYFFAYDYGILNVEKNNVFIITRTVILEKTLKNIKEKLEEKVERIETYEKKLRENIKTLERMILKKIVEVEREL